MTKQDIIDYVMNTPHNTNKAVLSSMLNQLTEGGGGSVTVEALSVTQNGTYTAPTGTAYSPVTVNVSGGGGSSDFSTATITFAGSPVGTITGAFDTEDKTRGIISLGMPSDSGRSESVILKNGKAEINIDARATVTVDGSIEYDSEWEVYIVTGDCSITFTSPK